ncbi:MAG: hypothetical protein O9293_07270 [Porphyrobacter sp.]|nr:hypothetical protein [Porphyrobacter sp.]
MRRLGGARLAALWLLVAGSPIWVVHTYGWAFLGLLCGAAMIAEVVASRASLAWALGRILAACGPLLVPLVFMVLWRANAGASYAGGWSLALKMMWLVSVFRSQWMVPDLLSVTLLIMLVYWAIRERDVTWDARLAIAAALALVSYLLLPMYVMGSAYADMRLVPYALALALLAIAPARLPAHAMRRLMLAAGAFLAVRTIAVGWSYVEQDRLVEKHFLALEAVPEGSRLVVLIVKPCTQPWALPVTDHIGSLAMVRKNIFANDQWEGPGVNPLHVTFPAGGDFVRDPSQIVQVDGCRPQAARYLSDSIQALPRAAFTHVWIIGEATAAMPVPAGLERLAHRGKGQLFVVNHSPAPRR